MKQSNILISKNYKDYELIDSGEGEKLERFGDMILSRPDPQALWTKRMDKGEWKNAIGKFNRENVSIQDPKSGWVMKEGSPSKISVEYGGLKFVIRPTTFKHVGLFPEQESNWRWLESQIEKLKNENNNQTEKDIEVLNLFGYTGGATLSCAKSGAKVVHIDGSKVAVSWARENAELSGLEKKPIRWILEDARVFVSREIKRERKYDGIIMDPPAFGHGPDNELWKIEEHLRPLIEDCFKILKDKPTFFLINGYSAGYSAIAYENILLPLKNKYGGSIEIGELSIQESQKEGLCSRTLPCGIFARWSR